MPSGGCLLAHALDLVDEEDGTCMKPVLYFFGVLSCPKLSIFILTPEGMPWEFMEINCFFGKYER